MIPFLKITEAVAERLWLHKTKYHYWQFVPVSPIMSCPDPFYELRGLRGHRLCHFEINPAAGRK